MDFYVGIGGLVGRQFEITEGYGQSAMLEFFAWQKSAAPFLPHFHLPVAWLGCVRYIRTCSWRGMPVLIVIPVTKFT